MVEIIGFGMTELSPAALAMMPWEGIENAGAAGRLLPNLEARLVDENENDLPESEESVGELWIRGPTVMKGYLHNASSTKDTITDDGWLKTGDIAKRDKKGFFRIVDRKKELIKYNVGVRMLSHTVMLIFFFFTGIPSTTRRAGRPLDHTSKRRRCRSCWCARQRARAPQSVYRSEKTDERCYCPTTGRKGGSGMDQASSREAEIPAGWRDRHPRNSKKVRHIWRPIPLELEV